MIDEGAAMVGVVTRAPTGGHAPLGRASRALWGCALRTAWLLATGRLRQPRAHVGWRARFADGTTAAVYRETTVVRWPPDDPVVLVVEFRLRRVRRRLWHALFRRESVLNTVLFAGFPGFVSKLWMRDDEEGRYRGLYEWDSRELAERYVGALWWALTVVAEPASIDHVVLPGLRRDELLADPQRADAMAPEEGRAWWRLAGWDRSSR